MASAVGPDPHDTVVLPGSATWPDTSVLVPAPAASPPAGWYADPYGSAGLRFWDGFGWTGQSTEFPIAPRKRRSILVAFVLAFFFGGLALPYALPLPGWARLLLAVGIVFLLGWWTLLAIPLSWPFALVAVPLLTFACHPRR